jgi:hypothetical protein
MSEPVRNEHGLFAKKGDSERKVRSIRLTDKTWDTLGEKADDKEMTRADFLEALVTGEIEWDEENENESNVDFDVDEVAKILKDALNFKGNATKKIKAEIEKVLELMGIEIEELDNTD